MITIETWSKETWPDGTLALKASTFVRHNNKRVDPWFARYVQGQEPPNYPMPAIRRFVQYTQHSGNKGNFGRYQEWRSGIVAVFETDNLGLHYLVKVLAWKKMKY